MGIPLTYLPLGLDLNDREGNIWTGLGTVVPLSGKPPPSSQPKNETTPSTIVENPSDILHDVDHSCSKKSVRGRSPLMPDGHSWTAYVEDSVVDDENEHYSTSDDEDFSEADNEASSDITAEDGRPPTWHDIALSIAASSLLKMREEVKSRLGYTTSAVRAVFLIRHWITYKKWRVQGIARNKFLAKVCLKKSNVMYIHYS
jgi:DNA polymerase eta